MKNNKRRTVAYSYVHLRTRPLTFAVLWFKGPVMYVEKIKSI